MKTLYIIRHAKSDWAEAGLHDIERPLASRGLRDAPIMAGVLKKRGKIPEIMVTSPALRAFTTCRIFCEQLDYDTANIVIQPELYFGEITLIEKMLQAALLRNLEARCLPAQLSLLVLTPNKKQAN